MNHFLSMGQKLEVLDWVVRNLFIGKFGPFVAFIFLGWNQIDNKSSYDVSKCILKCPYSHHTEPFRDVFEKFLKK